MNPTTVQSMSIDEALGRFAMPLETSVRRIQVATPRPARPPAPARSTPSSISCRVDAEPSRAERQLRRQLTGPDARARQREVRDVEGADEQHERHAAPQQIQDAADASGERVLERRDGRVHLQLGQAELRKALEHRGIERVDLRPDLRDRRAGPQPADVVEPVAGARRVGLLRFRERQWNPELNLVACRPRVTVAAAVEEREPARHDADNRVALPCPTQPKIPADHGLITAVEALPQPVAQNDCLVVADLALVVGKGPPQRRVDPQQPKQAMASLACRAALQQCLRWGACRTRA